MKKKNLWAILATVIMALPLFVGFGGTSASAEGEDPVEKTTATIVVHKVANDEKIVDGDPNLPGNQIVNNGEKVEGLTPISGVEFNIYDMTPGSTNYGNVVGNGTTISDGTVTFPDLPKTITITKTNADGEKEEEEVYAKYQIREEGAKPEYVTDTAVDIDIQFPVYGVDEDGNFTDDQLDPIHIYPKNEVFGAAPEFEKYGRVGNDGKETALDNAEFVMYRDGANGREYLQPLPTDGTPSDIKWGPKETAETFPSLGGKVSVADKNANYLLPEGTYYFEETKTANNDYSLPSNYVISVEIGKDADGNPSFIYDVVDAYASTDDSKTNRVVNQAANITKVLDSGEEIDYQYGKEIGYTVTVDVPKNITKDYSNFKVVDNANEALQYVDGSLEISGLTEGEDYTITSTNPLTIDFDTDSAAGLQVSSTVEKLGGSSLEINYDMIIKEGSTPDTQFTNSATVQLTPNDKTTEPVPVETYGKKFMKVDSADDSIGLVGAEFAVKNSDGKYLTSINGVYGWADSVDAKGVVKITSGSDGSFEIKGLEAGKYFLEELVAPDQYAKLLNDLEFTVAEGSYSKVEPLDVKNTHKGKLPSTGGTGIIAFVAIGVVAVAGAVLYFTKGRRQIEG